MINDDDVKYKKKNPFSMAEPGPTLDQATNHHNHHHTNCRLEIKLMFNCKYNYKRAKCKDPVIIRDWFRLIYNIMAKYGILDDDVYNFNEASA